MKPILDVVDIDDSEQHADWTKQSWDLPPYKSHDFFSVVPLASLDSFRKSLVYRNAVANGLIHDDEWVQDYTVDPLQAFTDALLDFLNGKALPHNAKD